jgi:hypothetical protein
MTTHRAQQPRTPGAEETAHDDAERDAPDRPAPERDDVSEASTVTSPEDAGLNDDD